MMRMLAWITLLQTNGIANKMLSWVGISPVNWLGGKPVTVILGLVYGYIPYLILVLYAGLDRIDPALIEAGRDLGLGRARTFVRMTLPLSKQPILTAMLITVLPMVGDYYTNQLLSGAAGHRDDRQCDRGPARHARNDPGPGRGAVSLLLFLVLIAPDDLLRHRDDPVREGGGDRGDGASPHRPPVRPPAAPAPTAAIFQAEPLASSVVP